MKTIHVILLMVIAFFVAGIGAAYEMWRVFAVCGLAAVMLGLILIHDAVRDLVPPSTHFRK